MEVCQNSGTELTMNDYVGWVKKPLKNQEWRSMKQTRSKRSYNNSKLQKIMNLKKGLWSVDEDSFLIKHVEVFGQKKCLLPLSKGLLNQPGKSCCLCWINKYQPNLTKGIQYSGQEKELVVELQCQ